MTFSFRFFREAKFFGFDRTDTRWFASLLQKLAQLSAFEVDTFRSDGPMRAQWRYHEVNWSQKNMPVARRDLDWLPREYLDNEDDFPFYQLQVSTSLGRIMGFWEQETFNVVLLDPLHNLQPSKDHNYRVDPCSPLGCHYSALLKCLDDEGEGLGCGLGHECRGRRALQMVRATSTQPFRAAVFGLSDQEYEQAMQLISDGKIASMLSIFLTGLLQLQSEAKG